MSLLKNDEYKLSCSMKKSIFMLITGLLCFTTAVMAQTELKPKLIITTGTAFGVAPDGLRNNYNPKIGLGAGLEVPISEKIGSHIEGT